MHHFSHFCIGFSVSGGDFISGTAAAAVGSTVIKSTVSGAGGSNIASGAAGAGAKTVAAAGKASLGLGAKIAITAVGASNHSRRRSDNR